MVSFVNAFLSYLLVVIVFLAIITVAVILGKKLRENKDAKDALKSADETLASDK